MSHEFKYSFRVFHTYDLGLNSTSWIHTKRQLHMPLTEKGNIIISFCESGVDGREC